MPALLLPVCDKRLVHKAPLDVFRSLPHPFDGIWLDSGDHPTNFNAWSYLALTPSASIQSYSGKELIVNPHPGLSIRETLRNLLQRNTVASPNSGPPWKGGWAGSIAYEAGAPHAISNASDTLVSMRFYSQILAFSHAEQCWWYCENVPSATRRNVNSMDAHSNLERLLAQIASAKIHAANESQIPKTQTVAATLSRGAYCNRVAAALNYIRAGDIYQINLAQRLDARWSKSAEEFYLALRAQSPARFGAFLGTSVTGGWGAIASISPELLLRVRDGVAETQPIKGTRPRPADTQEAARLRQDLQQSEKERAELNMIVDLERNDLGRVCEYGSVRVENPGEIETLPTLFHRVARITGRLKPGTGPRALLKAMFPGGSVTGAPKRRAMEIIRELEPVPRGPYCGAIGWLDESGDMEWNLAIRTAVCDVANGTVRYHAGSGIVADSDPQHEYEETLQKSAAFLRAVNGRVSEA